jgi:hypothetical protein
MSQVTKITVVLMLLLVGAFAAAQVQAAESSATAPAAAAPASATPEVSDWFHNPEPWFSQGADFRFREHYGYNWTALNSNKLGGDGDDEDHKFHFERYRTRWWTTSTLNEDTTINTRMTWEFRTWDEPASKTQSTDFDEIIIDNLNFKQKDFLGLPTTMVVGRQDIFLSQGWLVSDGTPLDGSRTFYFDALRFTWDLGEKTKLDTIYIHNRPESDWWLKPINDRDKYVTQEKEDGAILYYTDKSSPTQIEGYFMYKHNEPVDPITGRAFNFPQPAVNAYSKKADIFTFGGAFSGAINDNWGYRVEGAVQTGTSASPNPAVTANNHDKELLAFGEKSTLEYSFKDELDNKLHVTYEFLSGDNPDSGKVTSFNPLWGQWPQWSEMYQPYTTQLEDNLVSNLHRLDFGHKFKPNKEWEILTDYNLLWAAENTYKGNVHFSDDGKFRGQLLTCWAKYNFSKQLSGNLVGEYMIPGNYYSDLNDDNALYFHFTIQYTF